MNNRISKLIPLALVIAALAYTIALPAVPQQPLPPGAPAGTSAVQLGYSIENAPAEINVIAAGLGIADVARVPPKFYTRKIDGVRTFDRERAEKNLDAIAAICDGATWIISDIEGPHRDHVCRPDGFSDAQVKASVNQYIACWSWFRSHWPSALIFEWNLTNAREVGRSTHAEELVLKHLDGFAVSVFYRAKGNWQTVREEVVAHAKSLVAGTDKIVIVGIHERYNSKEPHKRDKQAIVPREFADAMVTIALEADVVMLWSNIFGSQFPPTGDARLLTNALIARMMAEMRLQAAAKEE